MLLPALKEFQNNIDMNKIIQSWQEVNNDLFGSIMLNEVLNTFRDTIKEGIELQNGDKINIKLTRFNMTGNDSLVGKDKGFAYHKFQDMCNCTGTHFMHDQWGFSNLQRPDGMWRLDIMNMQTEHIIHTIPIFLETDSGNDAKAHQPRITAMKLWQDISCGHLIRETNFVCIMRLNVEMCSEAAFKAAAEAEAAASEGADGGVSYTAEAVLDIPGHFWGGSPSTTDTLCASHGASGGFTTSALPASTSSAHSSEARSMASHHAS